MSNPPQDRSYGPTAVGLLALADKKFFSELLEEPVRAMQDAMKQGKLDLSDDDIQTVAALVKERNKVRPGADAVKMWEKWRSTGSWDALDWPFMWGGPFRR